MPNSFRSGLSMLSCDWIQIFKKLSVFALCDQVVKYKFSYVQEFGSPGKDNKSNRKTDVHRKNSTFTGHAILLLLMKVLKNLIESNQNFYVS